MIRRCVATEIAAVRFLNAELAVDVAWTPCPPSAATE
jgi:hypothetical protein